MVILSIYSIFQKEHIALSNLNSRNAKEVRQHINEKLEIIEDLIRKRMDSKICIESLKAATLIEQNITKLKDIEPQHNWEEIKGVLIYLSDDTCEKNESI